MHTHVCEFNSIIGSSDRHCRICTKSGRILKSISWSIKNRASGILAVPLDPLAVGISKFLRIYLASSKIPS